MVGPAKGYGRRDGCAAERLAVEMHGRRSDLRQGCWARELEMESTILSLALGVFEPTIYGLIEEEAGWDGDSFVRGRRGLNSDRRARTNATQEEFEVTKGMLRIANLVNEL